MTKSSLRKHLQAYMARMQHRIADADISPLAAAAVLDALGTVPGSEAIKKAMVQRMMQLLGEEWIASGDVCVVFSVLASLHAHEPTTVQGRYLACALQRLMACELRPGGPYKNGAGVVDPTANAAIARFLRQYDVELPQLAQYLDGLVEQVPRQLGLASANAFWYLAASGLSLSARQSLGVRLAADKQRRSARNSLALALQVSTLHMLGGHIDASLHGLLAEQLDAGLMARLGGFYSSLDVSSDQLLADAVTVEALCILLQPAQSPYEVTGDNAKPHAEILRETKKLMADLPSSLREMGLAVWEEMRRADRNHEIVLMPHLFADLLKESSPVTSRQLRLLGAANFFCWIATIIYDDFVDEEGEPARLPLANIAHRMSLNLYAQALTGRPALNRYVGHVYDLVDAANAWEVSHARARVEDTTIHLPTLPRYGDRVILAHRAFGHAIGPMLIVMQLPGIRPKQIDAVDLGLRHYLIARQLNDDLHDWRKDLRVGQLNAVLTDLLRGAHIRPGSYNLDDLVPRLEQYFFRHGLHATCTQILECVAVCRQALAASDVTGTMGGFMQLVDDIEASATAAMGVQADEQAFLDTYRQLAPSA